MATIKTRLEKIELQVAPAIAPDARDPELVKLTHLILGPDYPVEKIPCGITAQEFMFGVLNDPEFKPRALPVMP